MLINQGGGNYETCPEGTFVGRIYSIIDLGTQKTEFKGEVKYQRKIKIDWELSKKMEDGRPFSVSRKVTLSADGRGNMRVVANAIQGRNLTQDEADLLDAKGLMGGVCFVKVGSYQGNAFAENWMALPEGTPIPTAVNPPVYFSLFPTEFDLDVFETLSDYWKGVIRETDEYKTCAGRVHTEIVEDMYDRQDKAMEVPF